MAQSKHKSSQKDAIDADQVESENLYVKLVERAQDGIIAVRDGILEFVNSRFTQLTGYDSANLIGQPISDSISPASMEYLEQRREDLALGKELARVFDMELVAADGHVIPVEVSAALIDHHGDMMDMFILRDIRDLKEPAGGISCKSDERGDSILKSIPNYIMVAERDGIIQFANHGPDGKEGRLGKSVFDYVDQDYHSVISETLEHVFESGEPDTYVIRVVLPNKSSQWYETHVGPMKKDGNVIAVTLISSDITSRKRREEKVEEKYQEVEVRTYELEAANSELQQTQFQLLEVNDKLMNSQSRLAESLANLKKAQGDSSSNIVQLWDKMLMVPLLGVTDSSQARNMLESLVNKITETQAKTVMLDITGISSIDGFVARILSETISMAEMMGAKVVVIGMQPEVTATLKEYGLDLQGKRYTL